MLPTVPVAQNGGCETTWLLSSITCSTTYRSVPIIIHTVTVCIIIRHYWINGSFNLAVEILTESSTSHAMKWQNVEVRHFSYCLKVSDKYITTHRVINPGFPKLGYLGNLAVFQTRKPGFGPCKNPGFGLAFLPIFNAIDIFSKAKWIKKNLSCAAVFLLRRNFRSNWSI